MDETKTRLLVEARHALCGLAERSGAERRTQAFIQEFLRAHTVLAVVDRGTWLYAKHDEGAAQTVVVRADHDAVPTEDGARHLCGHDGHTASLLGLACLLEGKRLGKNVILLFQHAEETGFGAPDCCELFTLEGLTPENTRMIGCHNIPGEPLGTVLLRRGTFACASCGVEIRLTGRPTHAAYPENGLNPTGAAARLALRLPLLAAEIGKKHRCMALATIVGMRTGERAFGVAASDGKLWVTVRAEKAAAFDELNELTDRAVRETAEAEGLEYSVARTDVFPATENDEALLNRLEACCVRYGLPYKYLDVPFRWSEDFGWYGRHVPACFFGVGAGPDTAPLHTAGYAYPDELAPITAELFLRFLDP